MFDKWDFKYINGMGEDMVCRKVRAGGPAHRIMSTVNNKGINRRWRGGVVRDGGDDVKK